MSMFATALALLRRPTLPEAASSPASDNPDDELLTEGELLEALAGLEAEATAAEAVLSGAAARREMLLTQSESDDEILQVDTEISKASIRLDRIDRAAPSIRQKIGEVRTRDRANRWLRDRNAAAPTLEVFVEAIAAYERAYREWDRVREDLAQSWPDVSRITPAMPQLTSTSGTYQAALDRFRQIELVPQQPAVPLLVSQAQALAFARMTGKAPPGLDPSTEDRIKQALTGKTKIVTLVNTRDGEGRLIPKGSVAEVEFETAEAEVSAARATYHFGG